MNNNNTGIKRSEKAVWRVIDDDIVVLLPEDGMLHALGGCGRRVWELIEEETDLLELTDIICSEYTVDSHTAQADITEFIDELRSLDLLEHVPANYKDSK